MKYTIAVFTSDSALEQKAKALAAELQLTFTSKADYLLILTPDFIGLQKTSEKSLPLYVDFSSSQMNYRRQHVSLRKETLARALGLKNQPKQIVDATAGLGRDSFIVASLGFSIQLIERSPIIHTLVKDGIARALKNPDIAPIVKRMQLIQGNAITWLQNNAEKPDIIYLDPMFPERKKSALTKLDMRIFHDIVGDDLDAEDLLQTALACAAERVVVKRPRLAPELAGIKPHFSLSGRSSRFDIYII